MILPFMNKKIKNKHYDVGVAEVHYLWHMVKAKYDFLQLLDIWLNQVHDRELHALIKMYAAEIRGDIKTWEDQLRKFSVRGPDSYIPGVDTVCNPQLVHDQLIATELFTFAQEHIEMLIKAFRSSTTNDDINTLFMNGTKKAVDRFSLFCKYVKAKGWIGKQPLFQNRPGDAGEELCAGEAHHLWDHLTYRNDNIEMTQTFITFAKDGDFKLFLERGMQVLLKQARMLEKELVHFRVPLPNRPPNVMPWTATTMLMDDDNMFRWVFQGIQGALSMHAQALIECTHNDRIRNIFEELLFSELEILASAIKYGKLKGWLNPSLHYGALRT
ncbi:DUF3231 family protein [Desulfoscipio gibsoniae]|uniref:DUF3231 family protein n=1 Tax=Desulfoscipio gibsoniae DSM 7213 TaxID=767817 RepID=R4KDE4_9FIRM|nr:DUF3231 family protein [Desulfoscipio gibsoniae]AGL00599.1 Protein of unknown function (DUF3231) [Desulfoscipio gibsoniae DSM 7213]